MKVLLCDCDDNWHVSVPDGDSWISYEVGNMEEVLTLRNWFKKLIRGKS